MSSALAARSATDHQRLLARAEGPAGGPTLMCIAGIHGNEPAGVQGVLRVSRALAERSSALRGRFVAFAGNLAALDAGRRFIEDRKSTRLNSSHVRTSRMPSSA